jgi:hypothetical protein
LPKDLNIDSLMVQLELGKSLDLIWLIDLGGINEHHIPIDQTNEQNVNVEWQATRFLELTNAQFLKSFL